MSQSPHNTEQVRQFFDQWHLYRKIIHHDYMAHRGIHAALHDFAAAELRDPFTLLDIGCGDASEIAHTFRNTPVRKYIGVDLSPVALDKAKENLSVLSFEVTLIELDFTTYLAESAASQVDVLLAGYSVHHLQKPERLPFFEQCHRVLKEPGHLLIYDVFRRDGETRDDYLRQYFALCDERWTALPRADLAAVKDHAAACDYPQTFSELTEGATAAGFDKVSKLLFSDAPGFHRLYHLHT